MIELGGALGSDCKSMGWLQINPVQFVRNVTRKKRAFFLTNVSLAVQGSNQEDGQPRTPLSDSSVLLVVSRQTCQSAHDNLVLTHTTYIKNVTDAHIKRLYKPQSETPLFQLRTTQQRKSQKTPRTFHTTTANPEGIYFWRAHRGGG